MRKSRNLNKQKEAPVFLNNLYKKSSLFTGYERVNRELWEEKDHILRYLMKKIGTLQK